MPSPLSICHLAELDNDTLYLYGPGSLDALDRNWGNQAVQAVSAISFKFIDFDNIVPQLYKIRARFPSLLVSILGKMLEVYFFSASSGAGVLIHLLICERCTYFTCFKQKSPLHFWTVKRDVGNVSFDFFFY